MHEDAPRVMSVGRLFNEFHPWTASNGEVFNRSLFAFTPKMFRQLTSPRNQRPQSQGSQCQELPASPPEASAYVECCLSTKQLLAG